MSISAGSMQAGMWIDTFGAWLCAGAFGLAAASKRRGARPNRIAAISSIRESAIRTSGINGQSAEPQRECRSGDEVMAGPVVEERGRPGTDQVGEEGEQQHLHQRRLGDPEDGKRNQHADSDGDRGDLPVVGIRDGSGPAELRLAIAVEQPPVGADAAFHGLPGLVVGFDQVVIDPERLGAPHERAHDRGLFEFAWHCGAAIVAALGQPNSAMTMCLPGKASRSVP